MMEMVIFPNKKESHIYIKNPRDTVDWNAYTNPLSKEARIGIIIFILLEAAVLMIILCDCKYFVFEHHGII